MKSFFTTTAQQRSWPIGFHARSWDELVRITSLESVNLVELKPDQLARRSNVHLYNFDGSSFHINDAAAEAIRHITVDRGMAVQIHIPLERFMNPKRDEGLCQAVPAHHDLILSRYEMLGRLLERYSLGTVLTTHGPAFEFNSEPICSPEQAIEYGAMLFAHLDQMISSKGFGFKVGIENVVEPKSTGSSAVGYEAKHIDQLIGNSRNIGITVDSGHRKLSKTMSIRLLASYGDIVNLHLHSNSGIPNDKYYNDDEHILATPENLPHFNRYIKTIRRQSIPVILEIENLKIHSDDELNLYVAGLRSKIENR